MTESKRREAADRIHSAAIHLLRRVREVDTKTMGLSPARASALSVLVFGGARSLTELAEAERVTAATMSRLDLLERLLSEATADEIEAVRVGAEAVERALHG
jgi:hypothetical protein